MDITILIVNWNSGEHLRSLLESLEDVRAEVNRVLVLDNASSDQSPAVAEGFPGISLHRLKQNSGFAAAVNQGFSNTGSRYILLVNPDLVFEDSRETLESIYLVAERSERAAIVTCPLYSPEEEGGAAQGEFQFRPFPGLADTLADLLFVDQVFKRGKRAETGSKAERGDFGDAVLIEGQPAAALWLVSREAWNDVGGMDESFYPAWFEDVDFCLRAGRKGWKFYSAVRVPRVYHAGGSSLSALGFRRFLGIYYRNLLRYWWKHHRWSYPAVLPAVGIGLLVRLFLHLVGRYPRR